MSKIEILTETLVDENGIEILVSFTKEFNSQVEECHGPKEVGGWEIELTSVEIVIAGTGIELLPKLNFKQRNAIIDELESIIA